MRILAFDIETSPNLADVWGLWNQNVSINQLRESTQVICWVAKWIGGVDRPEFRSVHHDGHEKMIRRMWALLDESDVVIHYNGRRFDVPHMNREFLTLGLKPPAPFRQIDLLETIKRQFRFPSNKLAYVSKVLGLSGKMEHEGHALWIKCMAGDPDAWERMREYNVRDVTLLEDLYSELRPWITNHPNRALYEDPDPDAVRCPTCGGRKYERRGYARTNVSTYPRYHCLAESCGRWFRGSKRIANVTTQVVAASGG